MFDERGEGLILRGGRMVESDEDRKPHLTAQDAYDLLRNSLKVFRDRHGHWPARVALHKTSRFDRNELDGFHKAIDERDIDYADFIWVQKSLNRLYRLGIYPPAPRFFRCASTRPKLFSTHAAVLSSFVLLRECTCRVR
ncbi:hypothetical protein ACQR16_34580 [Bradyrhizobium oligotrophicum]|uniref:hypothetical protein n=1 Tax=Bradyrhizobium oligotrophicum TaxID=44255 RepID=UPI003EBE0B81